ncbi:MAG: nuclear transport factor 2 family protein [Thermoleophilaceae bacterium]|nr:nuclear transport factor 2 family protein [Thermoleophilaceae bacterium]
MDATFEERIRAAYAAFVAGDLDATLAHISPEIVFINPEYAVDGGTATGLPALRGALDRLHENFLELSIEIGEILEAPGAVVVTSRWRGEGRVSGAPIDQMLTHVFDCTGGRVVKWRWFRSQAEGREAAGL